MRKRVSTWSSLFNQVGTVTVTSKGQVTIPIHFRQQLGIKRNSKVQWEATKGILTARVL